jgi:hypothetical protein
MIDDSEAEGLPPESTLSAEPLPAADVQLGEAANEPDQQTPDAVYDDLQVGPVVAESADRTAALLTEISGAVRELVISSERHHSQAERREDVIDHLCSEVDRLRRGERRGLLRPLLVEVCRLRDDLVRQAEDLPDDFDAERARLLLRSYADSVELTLENNGVITFAPGSGDAFEPRMHRRVGGEPTGDPALAGRVARVRRSGYMEVGPNGPIAPAEVVLFRGVPVAAADAVIAQSAAGRRSSRRARGAQLRIKHGQEDRTDKRTEL